MDFQSEKSFEKLRHRAFQPYHQILCILKHVGDVGDRSSTPKGCNAMYVGDVRDCNNLQYTQLSKTFFGLKIHWILSKLWAKMSLTTTMQQCYSCLMSETSEMWNISIKDQRQHCTKQCYSCRRCEISQCYVITVLRYFTSPTSLTWVTLLCIVLPLIFYWDISRLRHLRHE